MISIRVANSARALAVVTTIALLAGVQTPVWAATLIVDQAGSSAYTQVGQAILAASDGDKIHVLAGLYQEAISLTKDLTLSCEGPDLVTLRNPTGDTIVVQANKVVTVTGCTISGGVNGITLMGGTTAIIGNNVIVANGTHGIRLLNSPLAIGITNNVIAFNGGDGLSLACNCSGMVVLISNNITASNSGRGINTVLQATLSYNNVYGNGVGAYGYGSNPPHPTDFALNPYFVSQPTGDYRLASNSPCRNAGTPDSASLDPDGTRNDLGAYGGPGSAGFFQSPEMGPTIRSMSVFPSSVPKSGTITLQATGRANVP